MSGIANAYVSCYNIPMNFGETYHYTPEEEQRLDELVDTGVATYADARNMLGIQPDQQPERPAWIDAIVESFPLDDEDEIGPGREFDWAERAAGEAVRHPWGN